MKYVASPRYTVHLGAHTFPTAKFFQTADLLVREGALREADRLEPQMPPREDLLLAHSADWVDRVLAGELTLDEEAAVELPMASDVVEAHALAVSGTILACRLALESGLGLHLGGGSHHAFRDRGEGFCVFNDLACAVLKMRAEGRARRAMVVDLDVHQGNGTASIFADDRDAFTFSMHQERLYPAVKPSGSLDIGLEEGTGDEEYLRVLGERLPGSLDAHRPELVVYQAGVDVFERDLLGGLKLTAGGIARRDRLVFEECRRREIPVALTLGGGYSPSIMDTVALHARTVREALDAFAVRR